MIVGIRRFASTHKKILFIIFVTFLFILRMMYLGSQAGEEHDSGWFLSIAKVLAVHGIYASYVNPIIVEGAGAHPSIYHRFAVQDANGYIYFTPTITAGPGYELPEAMILKLFGLGWWQYQLGPLIGYGFMLFLSFLFADLLGGTLAFVLLAFWFWLLPQLTVNFAFQSYSEQVALAYLLGGFFLLYKSRGSVKHQIWWVIAGGFCLGLSFMTKTLYALNVTGVGAFFLFTLWEDRKKILQWIALCVICLLAIATPYLSYQAYQYTTVTRLFGASANTALQKDFSIKFRNEGSGLDKIESRQFDHLDAPFTILKERVWEQIGLNDAPLIWMIFFISPVIGFFLIDRKKWPIFVTLWASTLVGFSWFIFVSADGWTRYTWQNILICMLLFSILLGRVLTLKGFPLTKVFVIIFFISLFRFGQIYPQFFISYKTVNAWNAQVVVVQKAQKSIQGMPFLPIIPRGPEEQVIQFFKKNVGPKDRVYYHEGYLVAEMATVTDKVFYPLARYHYTTAHKSFLIFGPYQRGEFSIVPPGYYARYTKALCQRMLLDNGWYSICTPKKQIDPQDL